MVSSVPFTPSSSQTFLPRSSIILQQISSSILNLPECEGRMFYLGGKHGAGKSEFAGSLIEMLPGWSVVKVSALSWLQESPRSLLTHIGHKLGANSSNSIRGVIDRTGASTVVIIDDVHWSDLESLHKLIEFTRRMVSGRFALILIGLESENTTLAGTILNLPDLADVTYVLPPMSIEEIRQVALTTVRGRIS
ncbi:MAG: ATP-binding protein, partial [Corynebacterium sp.]|nr:ATP-binding protein [Corynebacterium sp.]